MRKVHVTFECDEKVLGPLIVDLSEKPNTRIVNVKTVAELPHHANGKTGDSTGLTSYEVTERLAKEKPKGFRRAELIERFEAAGLSGKSVASFLSKKQQNGLIERLGPERKGLYRLVKQ